MGALLVDGTLQSLKIPHWMTSGPGAVCIVRSNDLLTDTTMYKHVQYALSSTMGQNYCAAIAYVQMNDSW